jgi:hypothetical protein
MHNIDFVLLKKNIEYGISSDNEVIRHLITNLSLAYNVDCFNFLMGTPEHTAVGVDNPWDLFVHSMVLKQELGYDIYSKMTHCLYEDIKKKLGFDLVLAHPWGEERISDCLLNIGVNGNKFTMTANHSGVIILPFNICLVTGGNHSILTGIFKKDGIIEVDTCWDYSNVMNDIDFDGEFFYLVKNPKKKVKARNKLLGLIYCLEKYLKDNSL